MLVWVNTQRNHTGTDTNTLCYTVIYSMKHRNKQHLAKGARCAELINMVLQYCYRNKPIILEKREHF